MTELRKAAGIDPAVAITSVDFGHLLREVRRAAHLSMRDVDARTVDAKVWLTRSKITKVERGELPDLPWLRQFLITCGIPTGVRVYRDWERALAKLKQGSLVSRSSPAAPVARVVADPVLSLLSGCLVRVEEAGRQWGTGFFVSRDEVLTWCAEAPNHSTVDVIWESGSSTATCQPLGNGVLLLRLVAPPPSHPSVRLDSEWPVEGDCPDVLRMMAWSIDTNQMPFAAPVAAVAEYSGIMDRDGDQTFKLSNADVLFGLDGAPLLNSRTQGVCGLLAVPAGAPAYGIPIATLMTEDPGLLKRNQAFHRRNRTWQAGTREETELVELRRTRLPQLPLMRPLLELKWTPAGSRADLLHPRYGVVPYLGRETLLANLMLWREHPDALRLLVLAGAGGFGKTRTAIEVCQAAQRAGWAVGMLGLTDDQQAPERIARLGEWPGRLLLAVDYAETKPHIVAELLVVLQRRSAPAPARVVLIVRQTGTKSALRELFATGDYGPELAAIFEDADVLRLDADVVEVDRSELFATAATCFARRVGGAEPVATPALAAEHFSRPLYILAAALLATEERGLSVDDLAGEDLLLAILDRHEAEYWDRWNKRLRVGLTRDDQRKAVALAALLGADTEPEALALVRMMPAFADASSERVRAIARWLAHLYGSGRLQTRPALTPLEPDLLAEALIARELIANDKP